MHKSHNTLADGHSIYNRLTGNQSVRPPEVVLSERYPAYARLLWLIISLIVLPLYATLVFLTFSDASEARQLLQQQTAMTIELGDASLSSTNQPADALLPLQTQSSEWHKLISGATVNTRVLEKKARVVDYWPITLAIFIAGLLILYAAIRYALTMLLDSLD